MLRVILFLVLGASIVAGGFVGRDRLLHDGWTALHEPAFPVEDCANYFVMRGLEQDPAADPANAALVERCRGHDVLWSLSQTGDPLRFDRPARVRLRFDPIDMKRASTYPPLVVDFVYPPISLPKGYRYHPWGAVLPLDAAQSRTVVEPLWNAPWASLFARWSLGRGNHEVWLGGASIDDPKFCEAVEFDAEVKADYCQMTLIEAATGRPRKVKLPLGARMEVRLEVLDICRFSGVSRVWDHPWIQRLLGPVEFSDSGCAAFGNRPRSETTQIGGVNPDGSDNG
jgi:hypothetical protein